MNLIRYQGELMELPVATLTAIAQLLTEQARTNALLERLLAQRTHTLHGIERDDDYSARTEHARQRDEAKRKTLAAAHLEAL